MKPEAEQLLVECHRRQKAHAATKRPKWQWERDEWKGLRDHGPAYNSQSWFGPGLPEALRMRFQRSIADLERAGLLVAWAKYGRKISNIRLTTAGVAEVERLLSEAKS